MQAAPTPTEDRGTSAHAIEQADAFAVAGDQPAANDSAAAPASDVPRDASAPISPAEASTSQPDAPLNATGAGTGARARSVRSTRGRQPAKPALAVGEGAAAAPNDDEGGCGGAGADADFVVADDEDDADSASDGGDVKHANGDEEVRQRAGTMDLNLHLLVCSLKRARLRSSLPAYYQPRLQAAQKEAFKKAFKQAKKASAAKMEGVGTGSLAAAALHKAFDVQKVAEPLGWRAGSPAPYALLATTFDDIAPESKRLAIIARLTATFRALIELAPEDLLPAVYLCTSRVRRPLTPTPPPRTAARLCLRALGRPQLSLCRMASDCARARSREAIAAPHGGRRCAGNMCRWRQRTRALSSASATPSSSRRSPTPRAAARAS